MPVETALSKSVVVAYSNFLARALEMVLTNPVAVLSKTSTYINLGSVPQGSYDRLLFL